MDKKGWIGFGICLVLLLVWQIYVEYHYVRNQPTQSEQSPSSLPQSSASEELSTNAPAPKDHEESPVLSPLESFEKSPALGKETLSYLENDKIRVALTSWGGAIQNIELKEHFFRGPKGRENILLNRFDEEPLLNLSGWDGKYHLSGYQSETKEGKVIFKRDLSGGVSLERVFTLGQDYQIIMEQRLVNKSSASVNLPASRLNIGLASPIHAKDAIQTLAANWLTLKGARFGRIGLPDFNPAGFLGLFYWRGPRTVITSPTESLRWAAVKNQYFTIVVIPPSSLPPFQIEAIPVELSQFPLEQQGQSRIPVGLKAWARFSELSLEPNSILSVQFKVYSGPKEYARLHKLGDHIEKVMEYGMWGWVVKPLVWCMVHFHSFIPNYGLDIILFTLLLKGIFWPLQSSANRNMKAMQALSPKLKELQARYKDQPDKMQAEMMKLYREYGVNPLGGCLPMLVQVPIFIGFYTMLQGSVELRNQSFLWIKDLTQPDTVYHLSMLNLDINPLPLIMVGTQILLSRMTPQASDNPQLKVFQWMPVFFLVFFYNFASALSLYWTVNNLVTIVQTYRNLKKPLPVLHRVKKHKASHKISLLK
ncbi:preprotein translocase YidC [Methylacidiphilum sp. Yel]|jgi:YidC/Oxa1 family membrane protein insertase|uniref:membrane protein insertase YidC n=1 Tax=Methylacidiphilum sp. Yel TaxID=1847730 RepID=UPI00106BC465|nr:membrane protein insertase YidC [Methylacidiphilum sp. Yel]TFE70050.1 preprotein translocase YidC [Methylacidiphilum sp. Yel]